IAWHTNRDAFTGDSNCWPNCSIPLLLVAANKDNLTSGGSITLTAGTWTAPGAPFVEPGVVDGKVYVAYSGGVAGFRPQGALDWSIVLRPHADHPSSIPRRLLSSGERGTRPGRLALRRDHGDAGASAGGPGVPGPAGDRQRRRRRPGRHPGAVLADAE